MVLVSKWCPAEKAPGSDRWVSRTKKRCVSGFRLDTHPLFTNRHTRKDTGIGVKPILLVNMLPYEIFHYVKYCIAEETGTLKAMVAV